MTEIASLMALENPGDNESSEWPVSTLTGGIENIGAVNEINAVHGLGGEAREEAAAQAKVGQRILPVPFCQLLSGVGPSSMR